MGLESSAHAAYIGLGSNLGDREAYIHAAVQRLRHEEGVLEVVCSSMYETAPVGGPPGQGLYLNAAARVTTTLEPYALFQRMLRIESELGRERRERWGPRTIDLDLLLYDELVIDTPDLTVPHPRMHERRFVLEPLAEIAPEAVHPLLDRPVLSLFESVS